MCRIGPAIFATQEAGVVVIIGEVLVVRSCQGRTRCELCEATSLEMHLRLRRQAMAKYGEALGCLVSSDALPYAGRPYVAA